MGRRKAVSKPEGERSKRRRTSNQKKDEMVKDTEAKSSGEATISKPESTSGGSGVHPLRIDHILEIVFQHIIPKTAATPQGQGLAESSSEVAKNVQTLRLVCKQWKDIATRLYRRTRAPMISFGNNETLGGPHSKSRDEGMQSFLDVMKNSDIIPFQRYKIYPNIFVKENVQLLKDFMRICGPDVVELSLTFDNSGTIRFTRRTFPALNLTRMKTLTLMLASNESDPTRHARQHGKHFSILIYDIIYLIEAFLSAAKTLNIFLFALVSCNPDRNWSQVIVKRLEKRLGECMFKQIPKSLKDLFLVMPLTDLHLNTLEERELKLETLLCEGQCGESTNVIRKFLEKQTSLMIWRMKHPASSISLDIPRLDNLLHLELGGGTIQQFSFPDTFPQLITLDISRWKNESTCAELFNQTKKGTSLKILYLPYRFPQAPLVKKAAQCFPNIRKLYVSQSQDISEALQEVFVYFDNIEELYVTFPAQGDHINADSLFSGVSENDCQRIKDDLNFDNVDLKDVQHRPSILNLTKLEKLVLNGPNHLATPTDFTAHFVFLKMASLKELHIKRNMMSTKYLELLRQKLGDGIR